MANACENNKKVATDLKQEGEIRDQYVEDNIENVLTIEKTKLERLDDYLEENFGESYLESEKFDKAVKDVFGDKDSRIKLALKIRALVKGNVSYIQHVRDLILLNLPTESDKILFKDGKYNLEDMSQGTLSSIYQEIAAWSKSGTGENWGAGVHGRWILQVGLPGTTSRKERSGAYYQVSKATKDYASNLSMKINDFMEKATTRRTKLDYGWHDIATEIQDQSQRMDARDRKNLLGETRLAPEYDVAQRLMRIFIWRQAGDAFNNTIIKYDEQLGDFIVATEYRPSGKYYDLTDAQQEAGKVGKEPIFMYANYVPLKSYQQGKYYLNIAKNEAIMKEFDIQSKKFRALDNEVFDYQEKFFNKSVDNILKAFEDVFGLNVEQVNYGLTGYFPPGTKKKDQPAFIQEFNRVLGDKKELFKEVKKVTEGTAVLNPYWGDEGERKRNHFPIVYNQHKFPDIMRAQISEWRALIEEQLIPAKNEALRKEDIMQHKKINKEIKMFYSRIARNERMLEEMNHMVVDFTDAVDGGQMIPHIKDQKFAKRMTNSINPMNMRTDSNVYYSAVKKIISSIDRNNLIANLIYQMNVAESKPVRDAMINNFKSPFGFPDIQSGLGFMDFSTESVQRKLGRVNIKMPARKIMEYMQMVGSAISGQYLSGVGTAVQNMSAMQQTAYDYGIKKFASAFNEYWSDKDGEWLEFIQRSGITEFRDFFSKSLTNNIIDDSIELKTHEEIMGAILAFYGRRKVAGRYLKLPGKSKGKVFDDFRGDIKKLGIEINKILEESPAFKEWFESMMPSTEEEAIQEMKRIRMDKMRMLIQNYVNWAITKEYEFSPLINKVSHKNILKEIPKKGFKYAFDTYNKLLTKMNLTMSAGEEMIRTITFIVGVRNAQDHGILPQGKPSDFMPGGINAKYYQQAIEIGKLYSYHSNFGMTPQDVGNMWWTPTGNLAGKFKIWSVQKMSHDYHLIKRGLNALLLPDEAIEKIENPEVRGKVKRFFKIGGRSLASIFKSSKVLRSSNPQVAQMRSFLLWGSLTTIAIDFFILGPFGGNVFRFLNRRFGLRTVGGMRSDLLGLFWAIPLIFARAWWYADDEDEDVTGWSINHLLRHTMLGFVPNKIIDWTYALYYMIANSEDTKAQDKFIHKTYEGWIPLRGFLGEFTWETQKGIRKMLED
tara:strand:+ start:2940 stop:6440 length:3501 start_codon:yes stop_codon:yes gene_type:complete